MREKKELRRECIKHFENPDHSFTAAVYSQPVHYMKDGEWQDIDNTVVPDGSGYLVNKANDFRARFAEVTGKGQLVHIAGVSGAFGWKLAGSRPGTHAQAEGMPFPAKSGGDDVLMGRTSKIYYTDILKGTDLVYILSAKSLKENLVLKGPEAPGHFCFEVHLDGLEARQEGRMLHLLDGDGKSVYQIGAPYMTDASGAVSHDVEVRFTDVGEGVWHYELVPDAGWLKDPECQWPVTIDPTVTSTLGADKIQDNSVCSAYPSENFYNGIFLQTGHASGAGTCRSLINFELPVLGPADTVVASLLNVTCLDTESTERQVHLHRILKAWDSQTVTWNTMPDYESRITDAAAFTPENGKGIQFDITGLVKEWYAGGDRYGVLLKDKDESGNYTRYLASDCGDDLAEFRPKVYVRYVNHTGRRSLWTFHTFPVRRAGTVYVNDHNGNLVYEHPVSSSSGSRMPYAAVLVYNSTETFNDIGYGKGFRLNYHQSIVAKTLGSTQYYEWTDGTGSRHYFYKDSSNVWKDEDHEEITLAIQASSTSERYKISDKKSDTLVFDSDGRLVKVTDANGNALTVDYVSGKVSALTDGSGRQLAFAYTGGRLSQVTDPSGRHKTFSYENGCLKKITDFDGCVLTFYWYGGYLQNVGNHDRYTISWTYTSSPKRVKAVKEYAEGTGRQTLDIRYGNGMTHFTDERGRTETYMFDAAGRTVSVRNTEGYAQSWEYMESGMASGKLSKASKLQYTSPQYMMNPHLFDSQSWSASVNSGTTAAINTNAAYARTGSRSLKLSSATTGSQGVYGQYFTLKKGHTYTFSGYVCIRDMTGAASDGGAFLRVICKDNSNANIYTESRKVTGTGDGWTYLSVTFTMPADSASSYGFFYAAHRHMKGTAYFDGLQVEEGPAGGRRNLVENNDFTYDGRKFTRGSGLEDMDGLVDLEALASEESGSAAEGTLKGRVNADLLNVRSGPGTSYAAICQIVQGESVTILGTAKGSGMDWYQIEYADSGAVYTGYAAAQYIDVLSADVRTGTVNADLLNVRSGPGTSYAALAQLAYGTGVEILSDTVSEDDGSQWYQIRCVAGGTSCTGYVSAAYITETTLCGRPVKTDKVPERHPVLSPRVFRMKGVTSRQKQLFQVLPLSGKKGDTYAASAWGCADSLPLRDRRTFGVEVVFVSSDGSKDDHICSFKAATGEWQFLNQVVVARADYTNVWVGYTYNYNANTAYFDGLSLYKDEYWPSYTYDEKGNVIACTDAAKKKTTFAYDENSNVTRVVTPKGANFKYTYDDRHQITGAETAENRKYTFTYDAYGNVTSTKVVDPGDAGRFIRSDFVYTPDGNYLLEKKDCFGNTATYDYDTVRGCVKSVTDAGGRKTEYTYDTMDRLTSVRRTDPAGGSGLEASVDYTYEKDRLKTVGKGGMTYSFGYDDFGNLSQVKVGSHLLASNTYTMNGTQLDRSILANNTGVCYTYDAYDRVVRKSGIRNDGSAVTEYMYAYDQDANLASVTDLVNQETQTYFYSVSDRLARMERSSGEAIQYAYDTDDRLTSIQITDGQATSTVSYEYDGDMNETKTTTMGGKMRTSVYDALGRLASHSLDTSTPFQSTYSYRAGADGSASSMVQSITHNGRTLTYSYDAEGNITGIQSSSGGVQAYAYDAFGQLIRADDSQTGHTILYSYDTGGNMTSEKVYAYTTAAAPSGSPQSQRTFTYDAVWKDQMTGCGGKALVYDGAGNLISYDGKTFAWKNGRQLREVSVSGGTVAAYTYDHEGKRASKTVGGVKHTYIYSGDLLMCEKATGLEMKFSYDSVGNPVAVMYNGTEYYYVMNLQGDIIGLVNAAGAWVVEYRYDVWGNIQSISGSLAGTLGADNPLRYRGYYYDTDTELYYVSSRYYNPEICRFICTDAEEILDVQKDIYDKNLYSYCDNNPICRKDAKGRLWFPVVGAVVGAALGGVSKVIYNVITERDMFDGVVGAVAGGAVYGAIAASPILLKKSIGAYTNVIASYASAATESVFNELKSYIKGNEMTSDNMLNSVKNVLSDTLLNGTITYIGGEIAGKVVPTNRYWFQPKKLYSAIFGKYATKMWTQSVIQAKVITAINLGGYGIKYLRKGR